MDADRFVVKMRQLCRPVGTNCQGGARDRRSFQAQFIDSYYFETTGISIAWPCPEGAKIERSRWKRLAMDTFSPEFTAYWGAEPGQVGARQAKESTSSPQVLSPSQKIALEELVERVNAARSVV
jgi:hypothetical protein